MNAPVRFPEAPPNPADAIREFQDAMAAAGIVVRGQIIADGKIHRYHVEGDHKGSRNAWALLHLDEKPAGAFGCNKRYGDKKITWSAKGSKPLTAEERAAFKEKMESDRRRRAEEEAAMHAMAAERANAIWNGAAEASDVHPYLKRKGVAPFCLRVGDWVREYGTDPNTGEVREARVSNALLVPIKRTKNEIVSLQAIFPDDKNALRRDKDFLPGGEKRGCFFTIGKTTEVDGKTVVVICEGYATGASLSMATGLAVVVAFDAGNLLPVAEKVRNQWKDAVILVAADNDRWTKTPIDNPGVTRAREAAERVRGLVAVPKFASAEGNPTDFNDLLVREGSDAVKAQVMAVLTPAGTQVPRQVEPKVPAAIEQAHDVSASTETRTEACPEARSVVRWVSGGLVQAVDDAESALLKAGADLYQRANKIVRPAMSTVLTSDGRKIEVQSLVPVRNHNLGEIMMRAAEFQRYDSKAKEWHPFDVPLRIVDTYLQREGQWNLRVLTGVINAPTLRADGSILEAVGYDHATGLLFDPRGALFPMVPSEPTRDDALKALDYLGELIAGFPFVNSAGRSVALSGILTAMIRRSLATAPMHAFSAPVAGSGKSKLVDISSVITTGHEAAVTAQGADEEEMEKRIGASLIAGDAIISIDNCDAPLGGVALCQALTQSTVNVRVLGKSLNEGVPSNVMFFATGNNLTIMGDVTRRAIHCPLDPGVERPELRKFDFEPVQRAREHRGEFAVAALTILRAYHVAGRPQLRDPLGSFSDWSRWVRDALIWLGEADPCDTMEDVRKADPKLGALRNVIGQWRDTVGMMPITARAIIERATEQHQTYSGSEFVHPDFREALLVVAGVNGAINSGRLGRWLGGHKGRIVDGVKIVEDGVVHGYQRWRLEVAEEYRAAA